jgi:manganese/zinc-transporting P-type ATPase C
VSHLRVRSDVNGRVRWEAAALRDAPVRSAAVTCALLETKGVEHVVANPLTGRVLAEYNPRSTCLETLEAVIRGVLERPFAALPRPTAEAMLAEAHDHDHEHDEGLGGYVLRLVTGGVALGAILLHKLTLFAPIVLPPGVGTGIGLAVTIVAGYPFFRGGVKAVTRGSTGDTDTLITVATIASIVLRESVTALIVLWLLNLGDLLQAVVLRRTRRAIRDLLSVGDREVWVVMPNGGGEMRVPIDQVRPDDLVAVYAGEKIPVDGVVEAGQSTINEAPITGESMPVFRNPGERVYAGTVVEAGWAHIRAEQVGDATAVGRLIQRVEAAREFKAPIETIGARFSRRFVPVSFLLAGLVFLLTRDIRRSVTMLVVACPCAAGLATPTAVSASIGNAARRGVLIKGGVSLEGAARIDAVILDKTGTLTTGRPRVARVISVDPNTPPEVLLSLAASGELHSPHPLGLAVVRHTRERELEIPEHEECELLVGRGMRADMHGNRLLVGSRRLLEEFGLHIPTHAVAATATMRQHGETVLYVGIDDRLVGLIGVADVIRPEARRLLPALDEVGVRRIIMLTGDSAETADAVARDLELAEVHAELFPEDKLDVVRKLQDEGHHVAMAGDGINDAPSLAAADLGIAVGTAGSDVAIEAADVALASNDIGGIATVIDQSRHTLRVIKQNYGLALGVNSAGIVVGALGALNPAVAAVLHNLSTIAVVLNSGRLVRYRPSELINGQVNHHTNGQTNVQSNGPTNVQSNGQTSGSTNPVTNPVANNPD